jgi:hypothetical protein
MGRKGIEEQQRGKNGGEKEWVKIMDESLNETGKRNRILRLNRGGRDLGFNLRESEIEE